MINATITRSGIIVNAGQLKQDEIELLTSSLTHSIDIFTPSRQVVKKVLYSYIISRNSTSTLLLMAHIAGRDLLQQIADARKIPLIINNTINDEKSARVFPQCQVSLYPKQIEIVNYINTHVFNDERIKAGTASLILEALPGSGKTFVGIGLIASCRVKTLIICPTRAIIKNWCDNVAIAFPTLKIGKICNGTKSDGDVIVTTIQSAVLDTFAIKKGPTLSPIEFYKQFGLIIMDEVHMFNTQNHHEIFRRARATRTIGLSATPNERNDCMDIISHDYLGKPLTDTAIHDRCVLEAAKAVLACPKHLRAMILARFGIGTNIDTKEEIKIDWKVDIREIAYTAPDKHAVKKLNYMGTIDYAAVVSEVGQDMWRNQLIINVVDELYKAGCNIFIMGDRRSLAALFASYFKIVYGDVAAMILGGVSEAEMTRAANARICCASFGAGGTGLSFPRFNALVLAHPRKTGIKQISGRIFRGNDKTAKRIIVDIIDTKLFRSQFTKRAKQYKILYPQAQILREDVNWQDIVVSDTAVKASENIKKTLQEAMA